MVIISTRVLSNKLELYKYLKHYLTRFSQQNYFSNMSNSYNSESHVAVFPYFARQ